MSTKGEKLNQIGRSLGTTLCQTGISILKKSFYLKPQTYLRADILNFFNGFGFPVKTLYDSKYFLLNWGKIKQMIDTDWTDRKTYIRDAFDCDNYSHSFAARMAEIYDINSMGVAFGEVYRQDTGKFVANHLFNLIPTIEEDGLKLYLYDANNGDRSVEVKKGQDPVIGNWRYRIGYLQKMS